MRLTLRTLLAYMDEILEPADREELAKKVESSEFAHDLIHRTKDTMRRLRLSAPQVVGTGMALDPNTVAEYLDNMLPPESVADFERICLESDVHLAEVASAHHVLTMVLGEPAEVDPISRQRMYGIAAEAERRKQTTAEAAPVYGSSTYGSSTAPADYAAVTPAPHVFSPNAAGPAPHTPTHEQDVPDYLRANAWTRHGTLLAACAAVLLLAIGWLVYTAAPGWIGAKPQVAAASKESNRDTEVAVSDEPADEPTDSDGAEATMPASPPRLNHPAMAPATPPSESPVESVPTTSVMDDTPAPIIATDEAAYGYGNESTEPDNRYADGEPQPIPPQAEPDATTANVIPAPLEPPSVPPTNVADGTPQLPADASALPPVEPTEETAAAGLVPGGIASSDAAMAPAIEPTIEGIERVDSQTEGPIELGTYLDGKNVLLRFDPQSGAWYRLAPRTALVAGDRLLALPAFYPKLALASGLHVKLAGGTMIVLGETTNGSGEPSIDVAYGKAVVVNTSNDQNGLQLSIGGETTDVQLGRNATLALDVVPKHQPGQDPRESAAPIVAEVFVRDGDVAWNDGSDKRDIPAPARWTVEGGVSSPTSANPAFPEWIDLEPVEQRSEKMFGAPTVEAALDPARPAEDQLLELYESSRRREVKSLVARSSVYAGLFVPFVEALRDSDQKSSWSSHVDTLRSAMALGPDSAERIHQTLVDQRGDQAADDLYEMLCGYDPQQYASPEEFQNSLATQLVDWMENDSLDYRVLAVQTMGELTGMRLMPNPAGTPSERARGVRLWRQRLKDGEVTPVKP
jgi:hypothetical protein